MLDATDPRLPEWVIGHFSGEAWVVARTTTAGCCRRRCSSATTTGCGRSRSAPPRRPAAAAWHQGGHGRRRSGGSWPRAGPLTLQPRRHSITARPGSPRPGRPPRVRPLPLPSSPTATPSPGSPTTPEIQPRPEGKGVGPGVTGAGPVTTGRPRPARLRLGARRTNLGLLIGLSGGAGDRQELAFAAGTGWDRPVVVAHGLAGLAVLVLAPAPTPSRRALLRAGAVAGGAGLLWLAVERATRVAALPAGARRRFTGTLLGERGRPRADPGDPVAGRPGPGPRPGRLVALPGRGRGRDLATGLPTPSWRGSATRPRRSWTAPAALVRPGNLGRGSAADRLLPPGATGGVVVSSVHRVPAPPPLGDARPCCWPPAWLTLSAPATASRPGWSPRVAAASGGSNGWLGRVSTRHPGGASRRSRLT